MQEGHISSAVPRRDLFFIFGGSIVAATLLLVTTRLKALDAYSLPSHPALPDEPI